MNTITDGAPCENQEIIIRGITETLWDPTHNRVSSSAFRNPNTSVSRELVLSRKDLEAIFVRDVHKPSNQLMGVMPMGVGELKGVCVSINLEIIQKPLQSNLAHAEIVQGLSRGLALKVIGQNPVQPLMIETQILLSAV